MSWEAVGERGVAQAGFGLSMGAMRMVGGGEAWLLCKEMWRDGLKLEVIGLGEMGQDC